MLVGDIRNVRRVYALNTRQNPPGINWPQLSYGYQPFFGDLGTELKVPIGCKPSINPKSKDCLILWPRPHNPKDTTGIWRCEAFKWHPQLIGEKVPLSIPDEDQLSVLMHGVLEYVEEQEYGSGGWPSEAFKQEVKEFNEKWAAIIIQPAGQTEGITPYKDC